MFAPQDFHKKQNWGTAYHRRENMPFFQELRTENLPFVPPSSARQAMTIMGGFIRWLSSKLRNIIPKLIKRGSWVPLKQARMLSSLNEIPAEIVGPGQR
ncbi:unnamed protein product [Alternaria alternata]